MFPEKSIPCCELVLFRNRMKSSKNNLKIIFKKLLLSTTVFSISKLEIIARYEFSESATIIESFKTQNPSQTQFFRIAYTKNILM